MFRPAAAPANPLEKAHFTRVTDFESVEAAISPDGRFVAFVSDHDGPFDVWLTQVGSGRLINLTQGKAGPLPGPLRNVGFSGDGSEIWIGGGDVGLRLRLMPLTGGTPRNFLGEETANLAWSPDGERIVYHTFRNGDPMFVADRTGANARQIFGDRPGLHNHFPTWSPDGRWIYFVHGTPATREMDLWRIEPDGRNPERLTQRNTDIAYPTPSGNNTVFYVARDGDGSGPWLWAFDLKRRDSRRVSIGLEQYTSVQASADGRKLVATISNPVAGLWTVPILDRVAEEHDVKPFTVPTVRALAPRFGGSSLFYLSSLGTGDGLWRLRDGQATEIWKGADGASAGNARCFAGWRSRGHCAPAERETPTACPLFRRRRTPAHRGGNCRPGFELLVAGWQNGSSLVAATPPVPDFSRFRWMADRQSAWSPGKHSIQSGRRMEA
jgi:hypothetical protein